MSPSDPDSPASLSTLRADVQPDGRRTVVLAVAIVATMAFASVRFVVALGGHAPLAIDVWWHDLMVASLNDVGIVVAWIPGIAGGTLGMIIIGLVLIAILLWRRRPWDAANLASAMVVVVAVGAPMAAVIARGRPAGSLAESVATSFPSGHTALATAVAVTLGLLIRRWYVWGIGAWWVIVMMWSRTYLQAHWLSDVVAGFLEGVAVASLVWCAVEGLRDRRAARSGRPDSSGAGTEVLVDA
jgi:membrane-associated phospholipid phosphatase